jgi:hypothetical protein
MLKCLGQEERTLARNVNYAINIENINFEQTAVAPNGLDIQVIDAIIFSKGSSNNPADYSLKVNVNSLNGNDVSELADGNVTVVPEFLPTHVTITIVISIFTLIVLTKYCNLLKTKFLT